MAILDQPEDAEYLRRLYWDHNYTLRGIALECNTNPTTVRDRMKHHGISVRSAKEASHIRHKESGRRDLISSDDLYDLYQNKLMSCEKIAEKVGVAGGIVHRWLKELKILTRTIGEANHLARGQEGCLSEEAIEWLNGELLGDACVYGCRQNSGRVHYSSKYKEYIDYVSNTLEYYGIKQTGVIRVNHTYKIRNEPFKAPSRVYIYQSRKYGVLRDLYDKWYDNGIKKVPRDLELTPLTCRQWYLGDGGLNTRYKNITLYTNGFEENCIDFLIEKLAQLGFGVVKTKRKAIKMHKHSVEPFLNYIGSCPVECYQYKWDLSRVKK